MLPLKRTINPPPGRRGYKVSTAQQTVPLVYLGWGLRRYGEEPIPLSLNFGWVYAVVIEGNPTLLLEGESVICKPGDAMIFGVDCAMGWSDAAKAQSQVLVLIWEKPPTIESLQPQRSAWRRWNLDTNKLVKLDRVFRECRRELAEADDFSSEALTGLQRQLDVAWLRSRADSATTQQHVTRYATGLNWMRHNLNASHPVAELSIYLGVSEATLQRIFKRHTGQSPIAVFQSLKAEEAQHLLAGGASVKSVAWQLGYKHSNDFTRFYKKTFGHAPTRS